MRSLRPRGACQRTISPTWTSSRDGIAPWLDTSTTGRSSASRDDVLSISRATMDSSAQPTRVVIFSDLSALRVSGDGLDSVRAGYRPTARCEPHSQAAR